MIFRTYVTARYAETDQMGIIHHAVYPVWYEMARTEFIKETGFTYSEIEAKGILLPIRELNCTYLKPAFYEDKLIIQTTIKQCTPVRISFAYEIFRGSEKKPINIGFTTHVWTDQNIKPIHLKKRYPDLYESVSRLMEPLA